MLIKIVLLRVILSSYTFISINQTRMPLYCRLVLLTKHICHYIVNENINRLYLSYLRDAAGYPS